MASKADIECEVCFELFDDNFRIPKFLECFHTYCVPCLKDIVWDGNIICPACKKETSIFEEEQVEKLQTNFYLTSSNIGEKASKDRNKDVRDPIRDGLKDSELKVGKPVAGDGEKLQAALAARRKMGEKLDITLESFQTFFQDLYEMRKMNRQKMKNIERCIEELKSGVKNEGLLKQDKKSGKLKLKGETGQPKIRATESSFADLVAKLCEEAQESYSLLTNIAELSFSLNIDVDFIDEENSATEFFGNPIELGVVPDQASGREGQSLVALLHLVFLNTETGKKWCAGFLNDDKAHKQPEEKSKRTVAEIINQSSAKTLDENRNLSTHNCKNFDNLPCKAQQNGKPVIAQSDLTTVALKRDSISKDKTDLSVSQSTNSRETEMNNKNAPLLQAPSLPLSLRLNNMKCFLGFHVNGQAYGKVFVELCAELAPCMSRRFALLCQNTTETCYRGSTIFKSEADAYIIGGRTSGAEDLFMADPSPLKRHRGAVFLRLKRDISKMRCSVVASEFIIQLNDEKKDSRWTSTVFGYVCSGLDVCDRISRLDCGKNSIVISCAGIVK